MRLYGFYKDFQSFKPPLTDKRHADNIIIFFLETGRPEQAYIVKMTTTVTICEDAHQSSTSEKIASLGDLHLFTYASNWVYIK